MITYANSRTWRRDQVLQEVVVVPRADCRCGQHTSAWKNIVKAGVRGLGVFDNGEGALRLIDGPGLVMLSATKRIFNTRRSEPGDSETSYSWSCSR